MYALTICSVKKESGFPNVKKDSISTKVGKENKSWKIFLLTLILQFSQKITMAGLSHHLLYSVTASISQCLGNETEVQVTHLRQSQHVCPKVRTAWVVGHRPLEVYRLSHHKNINYLFQPTHQK